MNHLAPIVPYEYQGNPACDCIACRAVRYAVAKRKREAETAMSIDSAFRDVLAFHLKNGQVVNALPTIPDDKTIDLRIDLIEEEFAELVHALESGDLPGIADGSIDLMYVILGTLVSYGISPGPLWDAVHAANLSKFGAKRADGKVEKPVDWKHPDIAAILARQEPIAGVAS